MIATIAFIAGVIITLFFVALMSAITVMSIGRAIVKPTPRHWVGRQ